MTQAAFEKHLEKIGISAAQRSQGSTSHQHVRSLLDNKSERDPAFPWLSEGDFLSGSYARGTKIHPLDDIDVMLVLDGTGLFFFENGQLTDAEVHGSGTHGSPVNQLTYNEWDHISSKMILERLHNALQEAYPNSEIKKHGQAVNVWLESYGLGLDIVPAFLIKPRGNRREFYQIPKGNDSHEWISTNPKIDKEIVDALDERHAGKFKPVVKLIKHWNEVHNASRLQSYHLETVAVYVFLNSQQIQDHAHGLKYFFNNASALLHNPCPDMTGIGGAVDTYLTQEARQLSITRLAQAAASVNTPFGAFVPTVPALAMWRKIFGQSFGV